MRAICALHRMDGHDEAEGFTEDEVEAIYWRNAYRFFKNNL